MATPEKKIVKRPGGVTAEYATTKDAKTGAVTTVRTVKRKDGTVVGKR